MIKLKFYECLMTCFFNTDYICSTVVYLNINVFLCNYVLKHRFSSVCNGPLSLSKKPFVERFSNTMGDFCPNQPTWVIVVILLKCWHVSIIVLSLEWLLNQWQNVRMSLDLWPPYNPCPPATNWGLSMVSSSQLQVAQLAQMCWPIPTSANY